MKRPKLTRKQRRVRVGQPALVNRIATLLERPPITPLADSQALLRLRESYLQVREAGYRLTNRQIVPSISKAAMDFAGSNLGMLHGNVLSLQTEDEASVLMDHAIFNHRVAGKNTIERYRESHENELTPIERKWLVGAEQSRHTLVLMGDVIPEVGVVAHDVFRDEELLLLDVNFSRSMVAGLTLATRLIPIDDFYMTSGAPLPILSHTAFFEIGEYLNRTGLELNKIKELPPDRATWLEAFIIRTLLDDQSSQRVRYADP